MKTQLPQNIWPINVVSVESLSKAHVDDVLTLAEQYRKKIERKEPVAQSLQGLVIALLFFEPSTRTMLSFQTAAVRLGATYISSADSSLTKGESLEDTLSVVSKYADLIVMRQAGENTSELASHSSCNLVNAGDGANEHPTQALIDLFAIKHFNGRLDELRIGVCFDPRHSRSIRSLLKALAMFRGNTVVLVSPDGS